jgi:YjbE family integral membrane protein
MNLDSVSSIVQIVLINAVLSGDNAVVIALAAHGLPPAQRRQAMLWGSALAIVMRLVLTFLVSYLLLLPGLRFLGAVLLAYIACKLIQEESESAGHVHETQTNMRAAIARIALADLVMSLDNVIAIAGVSQSEPVRLVIGLILSITMILTLSTLIVAIMNRFRWVVYAGAAILALTAADMMEHDLLTFRPSFAEFSHQAGTSALTGWSLRLAVLWLCLSSNYWWPNASSRYRRCREAERANQ